MAIPLKKIFPSLSNSLVACLQILKEGQSIILCWSFGSIITLEVVEPVRRESINEMESHAIANFIQNPRQFMPEA